MSNENSNLIIRLFSAIGGAIIPGLLGGAIVGIVESSSISLVTGVAWSSEGLYYYPFLGLAVAVFCAAAVFFIMQIVGRKGGSLSLGALYFNAAVSFLFFPAIPFQIIDRWFRMEYASVSGFLLLAVLLAVFVSVLFLLEWLYGKLTSLIKIGWRTSGIILSVIAYAIIIIITQANPLGTVEPEPYNISDAEAVKNKPNIILIILDTLRQDAISPYGGDADTPNLESFAAEGIIYTNAYNNAPWTKPSIASLMTSLHPLQHGVETYQGIINPEVVTLAKALSDMGYYTVTFQNNPHINTNSNFHIGFNTFTIKEAARRHPNLPQFTLSKRHGLFMMRIVKHFYPTIVVDYFYTAGENITQKGIDWIEDNKDKKFFMFLHYMDPHFPYFEHPYSGYQMGPPEYGKDPNAPADEHLNELKRLYRGEVEYIDTVLGTLFDYLKSEGMYDNTFIVITSDHGEEFYDHGGWGHGNSLYDEQLQANLLIKLPGEEMKGTVDSSLTESIDIAPTIVGYAGGEIPGQWEGRNIFSSEPIRWTFGKIGLPRYKAESITSREEKLFLNTVHHGDSLKLVELYDMIDDPLERNNLAGHSEYQKRVKTLRDTLTSMGTDYVSRSIKSEEMELDKATMEQLKALGYIE